MSLTLREVQLSDCGTFDRWRADPRLVSMLRRPGEIVKFDRGWYQAVVEGDTLRGYVAIDAGEVSVLTDPDHPCDGEALALAIAEAQAHGVPRLFAETYTPERATLVRAAGFQPVQHWTLLLQTPGPTSGRASPETAGG